MTAKCPSCGRYTFECAVVGAGREKSGVLKFMPVTDAECSTCGLKVNRKDIARAIGAEGKHEQL